MESNSTGRPTGREVPEPESKAPRDPSSYQYDTSKYLCLSPLASLRNTPLIVAAPSELQKAREALNVAVKQLARTATVGANHMFISQAELAIDAAQSAITRAIRAADTADAVAAQTSEAR